MTTDYKNKKVLVMGLGLHGGGISSAAFFARLGCQITITDLKQAAELKQSINKLKKFKNIKYVLGRHRKNDFKRADLIIRNPAVPNDSPFLTIARQHNIPVHTDISWFLSQLPITNYQLPIIIGITGTKGKSTTAALLHHILTHCGKKSLLSGNICQSPLDFIRITNYELRITNYEFLIIELSSWQLESLNEHKLSPHIAAITNILPDHLNRYKNFADYIKTKCFIFKYQTKDGVLFLNQNDQVSRKIRQKKSIKAKIIWYGAEKHFKSLQDLKCFHLHQNNLQAVLAIAEYLKLNKKIVRQAIKTFPGLEGRLELIDIIGGVKYYNDTCATQPEAAMYAIEKITNYELRITNLILIAGGEDKNLDYKKFARAIAKNVKTLILFKGSASDKIIKILKKYPNTQYLISNIQSMKKAISIAQSQARPGDIVLLSPAAASFGLFKHEFDRGDQFKICVKKIKKRIAQTTS